MAIDRIIKMSLAFMSKIPLNFLRHIYCEAVYMFTSVTFNPSLVMVGTLLPTAKLYCFSVVLWVQSLVAECTGELFCNCIRRIPNNYKYNLNCLYRSETVSSVIVESSNLISKL